MYWRIRCVLLALALMAACSAPQAPPEPAREPAAGPDFEPTQGWAARHDNEVILTLVGETIYLEDKPVAQAPTEPDKLMVATIFKGFKAYEDTEGLKVVVAAPAERSSREVIALISSLDQAGVRDVEVAQAVIKRDATLELRIVRRQALFLPKRGPDGETMISPQVYASLGVGPMGFTVQESGVLRPPVEGCPETSPTVCKAATGLPNYRELYNELSAIKKRHPESRAIIVIPHPAITLAELFDVFERIARKHPREHYAQGAFYEQAFKQGGGEPLFDRISFGLHYIEVPLPKSP